MISSQNVQGHPCRAADGIQIDGLSASDAPSCSGLLDLTENRHKQKMKEKSAYCRKGILMEIFRKEVES